MKSIFRWSLILIGVVVTLSLALSVAVLVLVDPNDYREEIAAAVEEQTGRKLTIEGELSLEVFPCCGVALGPLALGNPPGWQQEKFAEIESASVDVQVWPLLASQELRVGKIRLDGLDLRLIQRKDGSVNWELESGGEDADDFAEGGPGSGGQLDVAGISITNSRLMYLDKVAGDEIKLDNITLESGSIRSGAPFKLTASLNADGLLPDVQARVKLTSNATVNTDTLSGALSDVVIEMGLKGSGVPTGAAELEIRIAAVSGLGADTMEFAGMQVNGTAAAIDFKVTGEGALVGDRPEFRGALDVQAFDPRKLLAVLGEEPLVTADPGALSRFELRSSLALDGDTAALDSIVAKLDQSALTGAVRVRSIEREQYEFELNIDELDADRYLAPVSEDDADAANATDLASGDERLDLPLNDLRALNLDGVFNIGQLKFSDARLTDLNMTLSAKDGLLVLKPLTANLYNGTYTGNVRLNVQGNGPRLSVNEKLRNIDIAGLLTDTGNTAPLTGRANVRIKGTSAGNTLNSLIKGLKGDVKFDLQDGVYSGTDLWYEIRRARALIKQDAAPPKPANPATTLDQLSATLQFAGGKMESRDFTAAVPFMQLTGAGDIDLLDESLDFALQARIVETPVFEDGESLNNLKGLTLPVKVKGSLDSPSVGVDAGDLLKEVAKEEIRSKLFDKFGLGGNDDEQPAADSAADVAADGAAGAQETAEPKDAKDEAKDLVKDKLRDFLGG